MVDLTFKQVLMAIRSPTSILDSVLEGLASPHLEDIHFHRALYNAEDAHHFPDMP